MNYYCTWCVQNYSYGWNQPDFDKREIEGPVGAMHARKSMNLESLLGENGWAKHFHREARRNLFFLLDDGWDVPDPVDNEWFGSLIPDDKRFPTKYKEPWERLLSLNQQVKQEGWRGLGLWIASQEAPALCSDEMDEEDQKAYWVERMRWCEQAGVRYWKMDWGRWAGDLSFRARLTQWAKQYAPNLIIEHAICQGAINLGVQGTVSEEVIAQESKLLMDADIVRTYDVLQPLSVAQTIERVAALLTAMKGRAPRGRALINCEDECYLAAAMGLCAGVMRHPLRGLRANGDFDCFFPNLSDDAKLRMDEVVRMSNWQEIMPPYGATDELVYIDEKRLIDTWEFSVGDTWMSSIIGQSLSQTAPARMSRGVFLPEVICDGEAPFVAASCHDGSAAIAILPRTIMKRVMPLADITFNLPEDVHCVAVFGECKSLRIPNVRRAWARDLLGGEWIALDCQCGDVVLNVEDIRRMGLALSTPGDLSAPGLMIRLDE